MKNDNLIRKLLFFFNYNVFNFNLASTIFLKKSSTDESNFSKLTFLVLNIAFKDMQIGGNMNTTTKYNSRTLKDKDGQYPSWLSGRQRKHLQAKTGSVKTK